MLIILYVLSNQKSNTLTYALGLLAVILIVCANTHQHIEAFTDMGYAPLNTYNMSPMDGLNIEDKYDIINNQTATYGGLVLDTSRKDADYQLLDSVTHVSNMGEEIQLTNDPVSYSFPTVDGKKDSPKKCSCLPIIEAVLIAVHLPIRTIEVVFALLMHNVILLQHEEVTKQLVFITTSNL